MSEYQIVPRDEDNPVLPDPPEKPDGFNLVGGLLMNLVTGFFSTLGQLIGGTIKGVGKLAADVIEAAKEVAGGIARAILGEGASMKEIGGAVDEKLGPIDTAVSESGKKMLELGEKMDNSIREQDRIHEQMVENGKRIEEAAEASKTAQAERIAAEKAIRAEVRETLRKAESAQESADGKSTIYYGSNTPKSPKDGDTWFKSVNGGTQIQVLEGGKWRVKSDTAAYEKKLKDNAAAIKNLTEVELPKISAGTVEFNKTLKKEKEARERELGLLDVALEDAKKDLDHLGTARPGNIWPDPHFQAPCWKHTSALGYNSNNGGELRITANGTQTGRYYQVDGLIDRALMLERGGKYLLTATVYRSGDIPRGTTVTVHMRQPGKYIGRVGYLTTGPSGGRGVSVESAILTIPDSIEGGGSTLGFYLEQEVAEGSVSIWDVQLVRAADNAMIVDGAITAKKVQAGAIETAHLEADAVKAGKIAADAVSARELRANSIYSKHVVANQITGDHVKANTITGDNILAKSITANELQIRSGNLFPDPDFQDPCWGDKEPLRSGRNNGGELCFWPNGRLLGRYYQPKGQEDCSMTLEPGASYLLSATVWTNTAAYKGKHVAIFARRTKTDGVTTWARVGYLPINANGTAPSSCIVKMPDDMRDGRCTIGFYTEASMDGGRVSLWGVHLARAADASLIVDGGILARHIKAGQITTKELAAGVLTSDNLTVKDGFIKSAMIGNGEITSAKIGNLDADKITTGVLDSKRIKADSITVRELRANSIIPIGGALIAHEPPPNDPTKPPEPIWWQALDRELEANYSGYPRPDGHPWRLASAGSFKNAKATPPKRLMRVQPGKKYRMRFWARATGPGSKMYLEMRDQNNNHAVAKGTVSDGQAKVGKKGGWRHEDHSESRHKNQLIWNWTVPSEVTLVETLLEFNPDVEYVYLGVLWYNDGYDRGERTTKPQNQWIAGLSIDLDVPDQAEIDALQDANIKRVQEAAELNTRFVAEQKKFNRLSQNALWSHQDMIELLDIRSPKVYGWTPTSGGRVERRLTTGLVGYAWETPYIWFSQATEKRCYLSCRGRWVGKVTVSINWTNGAVDEWTINVSETKRAWCFDGGASHIGMRSYTVVVYPRSLMRDAEVGLRSGAKNPKKLSGDLSRPSYEWHDQWDKNGLVRVCEPDQFRLKNTVVCDRDVWVRDENNNRLRIAAGKPISGYALYPEDQQAVNVRYKFTEVDDPMIVDSKAKPSTVDGAVPDTGITTINAS